MEGTKFDTGKARWELVPTEYFVQIAQSIKPFIEMHMIRDGEIVFDKDYLYNVARSNIFRWKDLGQAGMVGRLHPLMVAFFSLLMLAKRREYKYEEVMNNPSFANQRWDLLDPEWTTNLAKVYSYGARLYEDHNWQKVSSDRYYAAANRHADAYHAGKWFDDESGFLHLYHGAWNCIAMMWLESHMDNKQIVSEIPKEIVIAAKKLQRVDHIKVKVAKTKKKR